MSKPIRIPVESATEGVHLEQTLWARGLPGRLASNSAGLEVEVLSEHEETEPLLALAATAVQTWLADHGRRRVALRVGERSYAVVRHQGHRLAGERGGR